MARFTQETLLNILRVLHLLYTQIIPTERVSRWSRVDCRKRFFAVRVVRVWNSLPDDVVSADSLPLFVGRLRSVDLGGFIVGRS